jgi:hypothetical protein
MPGIYQKSPVGDPWILVLAFDGSDPPSYLQLVPNSIDVGDSAAIRTVRASARPAPAAWARSIVRGTVGCNATFYGHAAPGLKLRELQVGVYATRFSACIISIWALARPTPSATPSMSSDRSREWSQVETVTP